MAIFSRKSKAKKEAEKAVVDEDKPKPQPYRHVPTHAASDAVGQGNSDENKDRARIAAASQRRLQNAQFDSALGNAAYTQSIAHSMAHGMPSPSVSLAGSQRRLFHPMLRNQSEEVFTTDPDAPPVPQSPALSFYQSRNPSRSASRRTSMTRAGSDYFSSVPMPGRFPDSPTMTGHKSSASRNHIYSNPHHSSDSGYESNGPSAMHSRAPSEQNSDDHNNNNSKQYLPRIQGGLMPEMSFSDELMSEPAFSGQPFADDKVQQAKKEGVLKNSYHTARYDASGELKPARQSTVSKRARFQDFADSDVQLDDRDSPVGASQESVATPIQDFDPRGHEATVEQQESILPTYDSPPPMSGFVRPAYDSVPVEAEPIRNIDVNQASMLALTQPHDAPPPASEVSEDAETPRARSTQGSVRRTRRPSIPPVSILEGLKVNKRGLILDEEGEPIGELIEGNIIDCVRQKANDCGMVLDECGSIVGVVRTINRPAESIRSSSPYGHQARRSEDTASSVSPISTRRSLAVQPQQQRLYGHVEQPAPEQPRGRDMTRSMASWNKQSAVPPPGTDGGICVELDASEHSEAPPLMDHSEIFSVPFNPPAVPERSPRRESPAPVDRTPVAGPAPDRRRSKDYASSEVRQQLQLAQQEQPKRPVRPMAERTLSDLTKSYARPAMSSVPEDNVAQDDRIESADRYAYKGDIPADSTAQQVALMRSRSPAASTASRKSYSGANPMGIHPPKSMHTPTPSNTAARRATTQLTYGLQPPRTGLTPRNSLHTPIRRSPLSSSEPTPNGSDEGDDTSDPNDVRLGIPPLPSSRSRSNSVRTTASVATVSSKPRTYFTHTGRVQVPAGEVPQVLPAMPAAPVAADDAKSTKSTKKSRLSSMFRRQSKVAK